MVRLAAAAAFTLTTLVAAGADAQRLERDAGADVVALEREIALAHSQLTQKNVARDDCEAACRALGSMRRATDRLCALEPGPPCADARRRTSEAELLVREACPSCAGTIDQAVAQPGSDRVKAEADRPAQASPVSEAAPRRGGCGSCATSGAPDASDLAVAGLGIFGVIAILRARKKKRSSV